MPLLSKFQASNTMAIRFSGRAYCQSVIKMGIGRGLMRKGLRWASVWSFWEVSWACVLFSMGHILSPNPCYSWYQ